MKHLLTYFHVALILIFSACNSGSTDDSTGIQKVHKGMMMLDLTDKGLPVTIIVPDSTTGELTINATSYGDVEIKVGDYFQIKFTPSADMALLKSDLQADLLWKTTILEDTPELLLYKSELPDGSKVFFHFYAVVDIGGAKYEVKDISGGEQYPESAIRKMSEAIKTIKVKQKV